MTKGFTVYPEYWAAIEHFDNVTKEKVCLAMIEYGITQEMPDANENPIGFAMVSAWKMAIDNSIKNHENAGEKGSKGGRPPAADYSKIQDMWNDGMSGSAIADELGIDINTLYKRPEWKERKVKQIEKPVKTPFECF